MTTEQINRIEKKLEKIDDILASTSKIEEHLRHVPTKSDMLLAIKSHWDQCSAKRTAKTRWILGILLGVSTIVLGVFEIIHLF
jgi:hypothetical protein